MPIPTRDDDFSTFVSEGCPAAFRRLVEGHLPMVLASARRVLGVRPDLAEDVAQLVFLRLASKGRSLPDTVIIGAWLHRQTVRLALNILRTESRRMTREQTSYEMQTTETSSGIPELSWAEVMSHIDHAVLALPKKDREVIALRFGEQKKIREVAERLGLSAAAAEKRISRALEKLRSRLSGLGTVPSITVLSSWLIQNSAEAAPPLLAQTIVQNAATLIEVGAPSFLSTLVTMTVLKSLGVGVVVGLLVGSTLVVARSSEHSGTRSESSSANMSDLSAEVRSISLGSSSKRSLVEKPAASVEGVFNQLRKLLDEPDNEITRLRLQNLLAALPPEHYLPLFDLVETSVVKMRDLQRILPEFARAWAAKEPLATIERMASAKGVHRWTSSKLVTAAFQIWLSASPDASQLWLADHQDHPLFERTVPLIIEAVSKDLAGKSEIEAIAWIAELEGEEYRRAGLTGLWAQYTRDDDTADHTIELSNLLEILGDIEDRELSRFAVQHFTREWASWRYEELVTWLGSQEPGALAYEAALRTTGIEVLTMANGIRMESSMNEKGRLQNADRALTLAGDRKRSEVIVEITSELRVPPQEMLHWALPKIPEEERDSSIVQIAGNLAAVPKPPEHIPSLVLNVNPPPRMALEWVMHHSDPAIRDPLIEYYYRQWLLHSNSTGAKEFARSSQHSDEIKAVLQGVEVGQ